jgi:hypothetical protein
MKTVGRESQEMIIFDYSFVHLLTGCKNSYYQGSGRTPEQNIL